jgi:hypothetical protein
MVLRCTSNPRWIGPVSAICAMAAGSFRLWLRPRGAVLCHGGRLLPVVAPPRGAVGDPRDSRTRAGRSMTLCRSGLPPLLSGALRSE